MSQAVAEAAKIDAATRNYNAWVRANTPAHQQYVEMAEKCNNFFLGEQWTAEDKQRLESKGKPALTINEVLKVVNTIKGHHSTTRADIRTKPRRRGATAEVATVLTKLIDQILDDNDYERLEAQVFEDGIIEDRGYFDCRLRFEDNILGEVGISALNPRQVLLDPGATEYDPATWSEVTVERWMSPTDLDSWYGPGTAAKLKSYVGSAGLFSSRLIRYETFGDTDGQAGAPQATHVVPDDWKSENIRAACVIDRQVRQLALQREFVDLRTGETRAVPEHWDEKRVEFVSQKYQLPIRKRVAERIRWTVTVDHIVLHDDWSPYRYFTVIPYFPIFRRGRPSGIVRHLLDPQEQLNKTESQILHTINTTANSGWMVEANTLVNMTIEQLEEHGADDGLVIVHRRNSQAPQKIKPNTIPTGLENTAQKAKGYISDIPGVTALIGVEPKSEVSGIALDRQQSRSLMGLQTVYDNLDYTRKLLGRAIIDCVQKFYTEERVFYITDWRDPEAPEEQIIINQLAAGELVNNVTLGEYDIVVSSAPARDTFEETQFAEAMQLRKNGVAVPDHHVILASHLAGKQQIANEVKQLQGLGEKSEQQQQIDAMMQELQIRRFIADVSETEATVQKVIAETQLLMAKAQATESGANTEVAKAQAQHLRELQRMQNDLATTRANLANKLQLAAFHGGIKKEIATFQTVSKTIQAQAKASGLNPKREDGDDE